MPAMPARATQVRKGNAHIWTVDRAGTCCDYAATAV
jgi:hypothetical protein